MEDKGLCMSQMAAHTARQELFKVTDAADDFATFMINGCKACIKMDVDFDEQRLLEGLDCCMENAIKRGAPAYDIFKVRDYIWGKVIVFISNHRFKENLNTILADMKKMPKTKGYVYVVEKPGGMVKVGRSINPKQRIRNLQTQGGFFKKRSYITEALEHYDKIEIMTHEYFNASNEIGEWFNVPFKLVKERVQLFAELHGQSEVISKQISLF